MQPCGGPSRIFHLASLLLVTNVCFLLDTTVGAEFRGTNSFGYEVSFHPPNITKLLMGQRQTMRMEFDEEDVLFLFDGTGSINLEFIVDDPNIAHVFPESIPLQRDPSTTTKNSSEIKFDSNRTFLVTGVFLGYTEICAQIADGKNYSQTIKCFPVSIVRESGVLDKAFTYSVIVLVSAIYVNMGAALDVRTIKQTLSRPVGPAIGILSQFLIMPLLAYGLAKLIISSPALQLGLFITGCSPGGGASNIWTLTLGGNLNLSIAMTTISTLAAFIMMPFWIFTLGLHIFDEAQLTVPYAKIGTFALSLIVPLGIGIFIQLKFPKAAKFLVTILKPCAIFLIVFIVIFAIYTNLYLFQQFTWQIVISGMLLPWLGYLFGGGLAWIMKQDLRDVIAIGIETGVQNTGLAIFALRFSLDQPAADLTTVLPVAVAIMTPIIPSVIILIQRFIGGPKTDKSVPEVTPTPNLDRRSYGSFPEPVPTEQYDHPDFSPDPQY